MSTHPSRTTTCVVYRITVFDDGLQRFAHEPNEWVKIGPATFMGRILPGKSIVRNAHTGSETTISDWKLEQIVESPAPVAAYPAAAYQDDNDAAAAPVAAATSATSATSATAAHVWRPIFDDDDEQDDDEQDDAEVEYLARLRDAEQRFERQLADAELAIREQERELQREHLGERRAAQERERIRVMAVQLVEEQRAIDRRAQEQSDRALATRLQAEELARARRHNA